MNEHRTVKATPEIQLARCLSLTLVPVLAGLLACGALLAVWAGLVPSALAAPAAVINYPGGPGCTASLQDCLDNVPAGSTILVQANTYLTNGLTLNRQVSLTGVNSATVILHALANQRVLTVTGAAVDSSVVISGLTFANGQALGGDCPAGCGGAILITGTARPLLVNLILRDSSADFAGGALYADVGSPLVLSGVQLRGNTTPGFGGGIFADGDVTLSDVVLQNDTCTGANCSGAGLYTSGNVLGTGARFLNNQGSGSGIGLSSNMSVRLTGGAFQSNQSTGSSGNGAGIFVVGNLSLNGTTLVDNSSASDGAGAYVVGNVTLDGALFQHNQCSDSACVGGGLFAVGNLTATNTQFLHNLSGGQGGGAWLVGNALLDSSVFQDNECTNGVNCTGGALWLVGNMSGSGDQFVGNFSFGSGGALWVAGPVNLSAGVFLNNRCAANNCQGGGGYILGSLALTNTLFWDNHAQDGAGLFHGAGTGRFVNDLFAANSAAGHGNALFLNSTQTVTLLHTTVASPTLGSGAAIYVTSSTVGLTNTLLANYAVGIENAGGSVREDYSLFSGLGTASSGVVVSGGHSHTGPAGFVNPALGNYHLAPGSAAIDTGVNAGINFDIDGDPRPIGSGFDIGYDEYAPKLFLPLVRR